MSRTVRRKNAHEEKYWINDWVFLEGINTSVDVQKTGKELAKAKKRFHSDKDQDWNAAAWYRRDINKHTRRKINRETNNIMKKSSEYLDWYLFDPMKKNVNWFWF